MEKICIHQCCVITISLICNLYLNYNLLFDNYNLLQVSYKISIFTNNVSIRAFYQIFTLAYSFPYWF